MSSGSSKYRTQIRTGHRLPLGAVALLPLKNWNVFPLVVSENYETIEFSLLVFIARKLRAKIKDQPCPFVMSYGLQTGVQLFLP